MGAAAILKAMRDYPLKPAALILECPFGSLYKTVCARFDIMGVPPFPMAGLLCFWGGVQNGYWAFGHNPSTYAKAVHCPTLLLYGSQDERVTVEETKTIYTNLAGPKTLRIYPHAGHDVFIPHNRKAWINDVVTFTAEL
jgi:alpha-beta hydrolase superfamily lysophospholipase